MRLAALIGPRVSELCALTMGDVCWDLGRFGKVLLQGKGSRGRGKKERLVPLINESRELLEWWVAGPALGVRQPTQRPGCAAVPLRAALR